MPKVLVTGYGGFLGAEISRQLIEAGYRVRGVARGRYAQMEEVGVEAVAADITHAPHSDLAELCQGCEAIIHTAAKAGVWGKWRDYYRINTQATLDLLQAAQRSQVRAFVHCSSPSVTFDGQHQSGVDESVPYPKKWLCYYPQTKALAEHAVLEAADGSLATCALRPHLIWGLGDPHLFPRVVQRAQQGRLRRVGSGQNLIDVVHVRSAAQAHVQAVERLLAGDQRLTGQALFITDGQPVKCWDWISRILETADVALPSKGISYAAAYRLGAMLEAVYWTLRKKKEPPMTRFVAAQLALDHYFSIDRARELLELPATGRARRGI
jgi:nucleoside-diphosphate-sugar epimerase